jgi:hypothetical protein
LPTEAFIRRAFCRFGIIFDVCVKEYSIEPSPIARQQGYGFITFAEESSALLALEHGQGLVFEDIRFDCTESRRYGLTNPFASNSTVVNKEAFHHQASSLPRSHLSGMMTAPSLDLSRFLSTKHADPNPYLPESRDRNQQVSPQHQPMHQSIESYPSITRHLLHENGHIASSQALPHTFSGEHVLDAIPTPMLSQPSRLNVHPVVPAVDIRQHVTPMESHLCSSLNINPNYYLARSRETSVPQHGMHPAVPRPVNLHYPPEQHLHRQTFHAQHFPHHTAIRQHDHGYQRTVPHDFIPVSQQQTHDHLSLTQRLPSLTLPPQFDDSIDITGNRDYSNHDAFRF